MPLGMEGRGEEGEGREGGREGKREIREGALYSWSANKETGCFHKRLLPFKDYFHIPLSEDQQGRWYLELMYAGAALRNSWRLSDVGISFCATLKCFVKVR